MLISLPDQYGTVERRHGLDSVWERHVAEQRVRRRLAAIVVADMVGYSRLMREDETGALARIKYLRTEILDPKVAEFGGRIFKIQSRSGTIENHRWPCANEFTPGRFPSFQ